jgi:hypothetical protein
MLPEVDSIRFSLSVENQVNDDEHHYGHSQQPAQNVFAHVRLLDVCSSEDAALCAAPHMPVEGAICMPERAGNPHRVTGCRA